MLITLLPINKQYGVRRLGGALQERKRIKDKTPFLKLQNRALRIKRVKMRYGEKSSSLLR